MKKKKDVFYRYGDYPHPHPLPRPLFVVWRWHSCGTLLMLSAFLTDIHKYMLSVFFFCFFFFLLLLSMCDSHICTKR